MLVAIVFSCTDALFTFSLADFIFSMEVFKLLSKPVSVNKSPAAPLPCFICKATLLSDPVNSLVLFVAVFKFFNDDFMLIPISLSFNKVKMALVSSFKTVVFNASDIVATLLFVFDRVSNISSMPIYFFAFK